MLPFLNVFLTRNCCFISVVLTLGCPQQPQRLTRSHTQRAAACFHRATLWLYCSPFTEIKAGNKCSKQHSRNIRKNANSAQPLLVLEEKKTAVLKTPQGSSNTQGRQNADFWFYAQKMSFLRTGSEAFINIQHDFIRERVFRFIIIADKKPEVGG